MADLRGNIFFDGPAGQIEGLLKEPVVESARCAVVCHPHPLFGGTMHNKVVFRMARTFEQADFAVLRFNFRGAGRSDGNHDEGRGEQDDLRAAIDFILRKEAYSELWLAGFSFGSLVALSVGCRDESVRALVAAGTPVKKYDFSYLIGCEKPKLFVQGSRDEFGPVSELASLVDALDEPKSLSVIKGADHFFEGRLADLQTVISDFIRSQS